MPARRILVVDDEQDVLDTVADALTEAGYQVETATDAAAALKLIRGAIFDAAVVDFNLPDMNGVMLHRSIRQLDEQLADRTVFASAFPQSETNLDYYSSQSGAFLSKPFDMSDLLMAVSDALGRADD